MNEHDNPLATLPDPKGSAEHLAVCARPFDIAQTEYTFSVKTKSNGSIGSALEFADTFSFVPPIVLPEQSDSFKKLAEFDFENNSNIPTARPVTVEAKPLAAIKKVPRQSTRKGADGCQTNENT